jgi:hypothetical protein
VDRLRAGDRSNKLIARRIPRAKARDSYVLSLSFGCVIQQDAYMAVLVQLTVTPATQPQFHELDAAVEQSMTGAGGPPDGLMSHVVYPEGDGFVVAEVWRTESAGRDFVDDVLRPLVGGVSLTATDTQVRPVWSFARP